MTWQDAQLEMRKSLSTIYESREASQITEWAMEFISQIPRIERIMIAHKELSPDQINLWNRCVHELQEGKPIQYVIGHTWFMGNQFVVNHHVLIPRPETEELVKMICDDQKDRKNISILDIGTGSGCIPITLKLQMPSAIITTMDISKEALDIAKKNASILDADIQFIHADLFNEDIRKKIPQQDIIVSNPPYIPISEKESLDQQVVEYEPHVALFVPDQDPLLFYRSIAALAKQILKENGMIYFETHFKYAHDIATLTNELGFQAEIMQDIFGKERFVRCTLSKN